MGKEEPRRATNRVPCLVPPEGGVERTSAAGLPGVPKLPKWDEMGNGNASVGGESGKPYHAFLVLS